MKTDTEPKSRMILTILTSAYIIGLFLRIYLLREQVLLDDEWHSMSFVIDKPLSWILTHFSIPNGFTSTPLNIHEWILLNSIGWSELWLRLPSLLLGLLCLFFGPVLAKSIIGKRSSVILSLLIAISPILVFYSRLSRPYSAVASLGFLSILFAARWMQSGKLREGIGFAVCGVLAVYWHIFAAIAIGTVAASMLITSIWGKIHSTKTNSPSWQKISITLTIMGITGAILILPALVNSMQESMSVVAGQHSIHFSSLLRSASLFAGTANPVISTLFWILFITGIISLWQKNKWLTGTIIMCFPLQILALMLVRPHSCHVGIVLVRYSIILVPMALLLVAYGLQSILTALINNNSIKPVVGWTIISAFIIILFLTGPLPRILTTPNNFTNHGVFQHNYGQLDWSKSFDSEFTPPDLPIITIIRTEELSGFYRFLREHNNKRPIIEYPMMVGDHFNPHYFYQWYHQHPVIIGYTVGINKPTPLTGGGVYGNTYISRVLNLIDNKSKLHFHNLINMTDFTNIKKRNVEYIIIHKHFEAEFDKIARPPIDLPFLLQKYRKELYTVYEDANIAVFSIESGKEIVKNKVKTEN
jgi:hypothetical protein